MTDTEAPFSERSGYWTAQPPADPVRLAALRGAVPCSLPQSYLRFLGATDGGEGDLAVEPGWISLWRSADILESNAEYELAAHVPGFFGIGSSGGGELFALDTRNGPPYPVVVIPFIPLEGALALRVADSFDALLPLLGVPCDAG